MEAMGSSHLRASPILDYSCQKSVLFLSTKVLQLLSPHRDEVTTTLQWHPLDGTRASKYKSTDLAMKLKWLNTGRKRLRNPPLQTLIILYRLIQDNPNQYLCNNMTNTWQLSQLWLHFGLSDNSGHQYRGILPSYPSLYLSPNFCFPFFLALKHLTAQETQ